MTDKELIVIGGSSGSIDAIEEIFSHLPENFKTPIIVVLHLSLIHI